jgi:hypothetical protein
LYVAASLIKSLGGKLSAESDGPGHGTRMLVDIPGGRPGVAAPVEPKAVQA